MRLAARRMPVAVSAQAAMAPAASDRVATAAMPWAPHTAVRRPVEQPLAALEAVARQLPAMVLLPEMQLVEMRQPVPR